MSGLEAATTRCGWAGGDPLMQAYHDTEWGVPVRGGRDLYEKLVIDGFQAGLSWAIILRKRETTRRAFDGFDPERIARYGEADIARLLADPGIIRNKAKVNAAIGNAQAFLAMEERQPGSFSELLWSATGGRPLQNSWAQMSQVPAETPESQRTSKALKAIGFRFCGPTIIYAFMQAVGIVDDRVSA